VSRPDSRALRVLVVDDSAYNRRNIGDILASASDIELVGKAGDGEEALRLATTLRPDVITLDLEMPRMDGLTFLRILMEQHPMPVVIMSSLSQRGSEYARDIQSTSGSLIAKPSPTAPKLGITVRMMPAIAASSAATIGRIEYSLMPRPRSFARSPP